MKQLKFSEPLPKMILDGQKDTTWRIDDKKNLSINDKISLCYNNEEEFSKAKIIWVKETTFKNLTKEDKEGHEKFSIDMEMYNTYSRYMNKEITPKTKLKVIKFKII